ncbi:hypothetical protein C2S53_005434 [Perilla frutescens var. hirtella]|uniref:Uncharacterized protein n=1 Tax=Perilla frutescens var. hirtella TaxID=608512 RepID=A0AAD4J502_PERFH|nr:hypothetical protein C2S53_005434 [Perilla frutescens var. hirtella]
MSIPGNAEPGAFSGQQQQVQQQHSINFSSAIPIKKRRFPVFQPCSPPREEKPSVLDDDSKNKEESSIQDEGLSSSEARNGAFQVNLDGTATSIIAVKKEVAPTDTPLGQANIDVLASKPVEAKPRISLGPLDDLGKKKVVLQNEKSSEPEVRDSSMIAQTSNVKQEIVSGLTEGTGRLQLSSGKMNVELSLGPKEQLIPALDHQQNDAFSHKSDKSDSMLSLALHEEELVLSDKKDSAMDSVSNTACSNRSNWDLNTTMDVWEGSTGGEAFAHGLVNIGGFYKTNSCGDDKSSLTMASAACFGSNKGKHILDGHISGSSKSSTLHGKTDDSLGLRLAMPQMETSRDCASLSDNLAFTSVGPNLSLKQVQLPVVNVSRTVKSEPVDDNSKHDCSIGSCSSTNIKSLKLSSVKRECANNHSLETILQSSISPEKLDDHRSMKSEVVQERNQEGCLSKDAAMLSVARVMQHQESCASSSAMPLPVSSLPQCLSPARLPTCSELTTSADFSNQSEQSFHSKESQHNDIPDEQTAIPIRQDSDQSRPCKLGISSVVDQDKSELARIDENTVELCQNDDVAANVEGKNNTSSEMLEEDPVGSDTESQQNGAVDPICEKEDEEYEDGEVREHAQHSADEDPIVEGKKTDNLELIISDSQTLQPSVSSADQSISASVFKEKDAVKTNLEETHGDPIKDYVGICYEPNNEDNLLQKSYEVSEVVSDEKRAISDTPDKQLDLSGDVQESPRKEVSRDIPTDGSHGEDGIEIGGEAIAKVVKENCSGGDDLTLSKVEASPNGLDTAKDSNNAGNKSRIINLSRPSVMAAPFKNKSIPRLLTTRSGKERYSDFDGETHPRGNRDEFYTGGSNKFVKDRVHDQSVRNSRPTFMLGKGRTSGRFGSLRGEWDSEHDFASESSYGPSDYRVIRRKHASSISDVDLERNGYNIPQEGNALGGNRRKTMNDEFSSLRRGSLRRLSSGDRDGHVTRGFQMLHRIPRNMSPRRCSGEAGSDMIGLRNDDKFMQHLSDDIINPVYHPQAIYDELDGQLVRGNRNFSTTMQRKGYPRIRSKSPGRSRTRSPGPWSSPRRRSPNGVPELAQHRSPALYRMGRIRSPDHACFHDEMVARRRGSPSYVARHNNDMRDVDSGREHIHPRSADSNRRSSPGRGFPRSARRADTLDSREMGDGDEYLNGPQHSNKFHELRGDGSIDDRRKFIERRGPLRSFRPSYNTDNDNFRFHINDGPRPYRFCPDADTEFVERSNTREREFDGRVKHQNLAVSRRIRNIEEQQDGNYRPIERVWHDDGFTDARVKRRRF